MTGLEAKKKSLINGGTLKQKLKFLVQRLYFIKNCLSFRMNKSDWRKSKIDEFRVEFIGDNGEISSITNNEIEAKKLAISLIGISSVLEESNIRGT
ncbi:MAG: hypothetical protein ABR887_04430 [Methanoregulaceae archaeon]|jgi:hypothetical protein